ncbi:MAG: hypothetical protein HY809_00125 [Nitrospirae bacterium]|nr:hypothetical protein [Nitrospirota bacterium]
MVNRAAIILRYKEPFIRWINESDPDNPSPDITMESANEERTVYLISDTDAETYEKWIKSNYESLFEDELYAWYIDETLWPKNRTKKMFDEWFEVECHSVLIDTVGGDIFDDEI